MNKNSSAEHSIVIRLECTREFEKDFFSALLREHPYAHADLLTPRMVGKAKAYPPTDELYLVTWQIVAHAPEILALAKSIWDYIAGARAQNDTRLGRQSVKIAVSPEGLFSDIEGINGKGVVEILKQLHKTAELMQGKHRE